MYWSCLTANQTFMPSWGSPSWETTMDTWHCLFSMHLMMGIRYGNYRNRPTPAGSTLDTYPIICLHSLTRQALPVKTITRGCGSLTRPKQPCVSPIVTVDVTKARLRSLNLMLNASFAVVQQHTQHTRAPCWRLRAILIYLLRLNIGRHIWCSIIMCSRSISLWPIFNFT